MQLVTLILHLSWIAFVIAEKGAACSPLEIVIGEPSHSKLYRLFLTATQLEQQQRAQGMA